MTAVVMGNVMVRFVCLLCLTRSNVRGGRPITRFVDDHRNLRFAIVEKAYLVHDMGVRRY